MKEYVVFFILEGDYFILCNKIWDIKVKGLR